MASALNKTQTAAKKPLVGWLSRKNREGSDKDLPEMDVTAGVNRALRSAQGAYASPTTEDPTAPIRNALSTIEAALYAIDRVRDILEQACEVTVSAKDVQDAGGRAMLAESYDELRLSIDEALEKIDPRAAVLIGKNHRHLDVGLGGKARYSVSPVRLDISERGLNLPPPRNAFNDSEEIDTMLDHLDKALSRADRAAASYCRDAQYLIVRLNVAETALAT